MSVVKTMNETFSDILEDKSWKINRTGVISSTSFISNEPSEELPSTAILASELDSGISNQTQTKPEKIKSEIIYPQLLDLNSPPGIVKQYILEALNSAHSGLDAFGEPDLHSAGSYLYQVADHMSTIYPHTKFNEPLGASISYIRRATLLTSIDDISRSSLNSLIQALDFINDNPYLTLNEATDLIDKLSKEGWKGELDLSSELISALLGTGEFSDISNVESAQSTLET